MADPSNFVAVDEVKFLTGYDVKVAVATVSSIQQAIEQYYDRSMKYDEVLGDLRNQEVYLVKEEDDVDLQALEQATEEALVALGLTPFLLTPSANAPVTFISNHENIFRVRFRIDGILQRF
jgi:type IV pilus assembly protein PilB